MKLTFFGTRGYIESRTGEHARHSVCEVSYRGKRVVIDCGEDWLGRLDELRPQAIVVTHGHPDHAGGLRRGAPCPVYATDATWSEMADYGIDRENTIRPREPVRIRGISFEAFPVQHSTRAPAVGYRIEAGRASVFYVPDVVFIREREEALSGVDAYVGDGATIKRSMVRRADDDSLIGHTPVQTQLTWCRKLGVPRMIVTHCGEQIVSGDRDQARAAVEELASERGVRVEIATDGLEVVLR